MSSMNADIFDKVLLTDGTEEFLFPSWVNTLVWFGDHVRCYETPGERLVSLVVVPRREFASIFIALGCLGGGIRSSRGALNWDKFSTLERHTRVYWRSTEGIQFTGEIVGVTQFDGNSFISIKPDAMRGTKYQNALISISKNTFNSYQFSLERFVSSTKQDERDQALEFHRHYFGEKIDCWKNQDLCETLIVGDKSRILDEINSLSIKNDSRCYSLESILYCADMNKGVASKTKVVSPRSEKVNFDSRVVIADGALAFQARDHFSRTANLVFLIDRVSITQDFLDFQFILRDHYSELEVIDDSLNFPNFTSGIEIASFRVRS